MATITARIDDNTKVQAEEIADSIGLNLSAVINVFINRFVAERGFPFPVSDPKTAPMFDRADLTEAVSKAIRERNDLPKLPKTFYVTQKTDTTN